MPLEPGTAVLFSLDDGVGFDRKKIKVMLGDIELNIIFFSTRTCVMCSILIIQIATFSFAPTKSIIRFKHVRLITIT